MKGRSQSEKLLINQIAGDMRNAVRWVAEKGLALPGWTCLSCKGFNGEAKEPQIVCRACGAKP